MNILDKEQSLMLATKKELQNELKRREELKKRRPKVLVNSGSIRDTRIFTKEIIKSAENYCDCLEEREHDPDMIWSKVMKLVYGDAYMCYVDSFDSGR